MRLVKTAVLILIIASGCGSGEGGQSLAVVAYSTCQIGSHSVIKKDDKNIDLEQTITFVDLRPAVNVSQYLMTLQLGTSQQEVNALLDTGSSDVVLQGDQKTCPSCFESANGGPPPTFYNPALSTTKTDTGQAVAISYQAGVATAQLFKDKVDLGCDKPVPLDIPFLVLTAKQLKGIPEGILGLAYSPLNKAKSTTFMEAITNKALGIDNLFGMALCGDLQGSTVIFGSDDNRVDKSKFIWTPIARKVYYSIHALELKVRDWIKDPSDATKWISKPGQTDTLGAFLSYNTTTGGIETIVDSGSTLNYIHIDHVNALINLMKSVNSVLNLGVNNNAFTSIAVNKIVLFEASQETKKRFPTLFVTVENLDDPDHPIELDIKPETYLRTWDNGKNLFGFQKFHGLQILGDVFMENYYVSFDRVNSRIGFAPNDTICTK